MLAEKSSGMRQFTFLVLYQNQCMILGYQKLNVPFHTKKFSETKLCSLSLAKSLQPNV